MTDHCKCCGSADLSTVIELGGIPVENSRIYGSPAAAQGVSRGDLRLDRCARCGFVQNSAFDPALVVYDDEYQDSQGHSSYFTAYAERIIDELIQRFGLRGARALEIGCGKGDFLRMFCERSGGSGIGIDPTAGSVAGVAGAVEIRADWFGEGSGHHDADLVMCRHTLEHIPDVHSFLQTVRRELEGRPEAILYVEVPDTGRIAAEGAFWDVYYEHCSYFDATSLRRLLERTGFDPVDVRLEYEGQYLVAYARVGEIALTRSYGATADVGLHPSPMDFSSMVDQVASWQAWVDDHREDRVAIWAASSKAVALLSTVRGFEPVVAVDINPAKAGAHLPGSGLGICDPAQLADHRPDLVLVMNPIYADEIRTELRALGLDVTLWGMGPVPTPL